MAKFEGVQLQILQSNEKNQLVSAGAGSGKTTIMIEKIADMIINKNVAIENLLVVTFTVLAATEMKDRLITKLEQILETGEEKEKILNLIDQVKTASIDTIDGFSSKTIKKYFYKLGISPNIEILSDNTRDYYLTKAMKKTLRDYQKQTDKISILLDLYGGNRRNFDAIEELVLSTYYNVINLKDYEKFLKDAQQEYLDSILSENVINEHICKFANKTRLKIIAESVNFQSDVKIKLLDLVEQLISFNNKISLVSNLKLLNSLDPLKFSTKEYKENQGLKDLNDDIKEFFDIKSYLEKNNLDEDFAEKNQKIIDYLSIFIEILKNFIKNYNALKEKHNLIDFNDLNRLMLNLLSVDEVRRELQSKYKYIFIDEYQDVNPLQDELMNLLTGEDTKVFMVGDVKQSIYGFRGSSPEWFLKKYDKFKLGDQIGKAFDMNVNFRSSPTILNFVNELYSYLMTKESADIDYKKDAIVEPKRDDIVDDKVKIMLVSNKQEKTFANGVYSVKEHIHNESLNPKGQEALLVLKVITELIGTEFYDANLKQTRQITYKDIAILSRSEKDESAKELINLLKENCVPLNLTNKLDVKQNETIKLILSILKCITNTADDVDYLSLFMSLTDMDIDDIIEIRDKENSLYNNLISNKYNDKIKQGFDFIDDIRNSSYVKTNTELIRYILDNKKLKYFILSKPNGNKELGLLEEFLNKISPIEDSLNLNEFIDIVESNVDSSGDFSTQDSEDSVTIQTIHKSKGLEYPVVILFNSSKMFSYLREHDGITFDAELGLGLDYFNVVERTKTESLTKYAIGLKNKEKGYKEELRLLYVALTRAKNKLYITGTYSPNAMEERKFNKTSYTNMVLDCFKNKIDKDYTNLNNCEIYLYDEIDCLNTGKVEETKRVEMFNADFVYPDLNKFDISLKNTVTGLSSSNKQENKYYIKDVLKMDTQYDYEEDRAIVGTHYHSALECLDLSNDYNKNTDFEDVDYEKVKKAHAAITELCKNATNIYKEADFEMYVPYCELVESQIQDKVLVQGVVDLIVERDDSIDIVDYKFSSLNLKSLKSKYAEQLSLYKKAVEYAFKKPVKNTYIYSINSGELG